MIMVQTLSSSIISDIRKFISIYFSGCNGRVALSQCMPIFRDGMPVNTGINLAKKLGYRPILSADILVLLYQYRLSAYR